MQFSLIFLATAMAALVISTQVTPDVEARLPLNARQDTPCFIMTCEPYGCCENAPNCVDGTVCTMYTRLAIMCSRY